MIGLVLAVSFFVANLGIQYVIAQSDPATKAKMLEAQRKEQLAGKLGVTAAFGEDAVGLGKRLEEKGFLKLDSGAVCYDSKLTPMVPKTKNRSESFTEKFKDCVLQPKEELEGQPRVLPEDYTLAYETLIELFARYDDDATGTIDKRELTLLLQNDMGEDDGKGMTEKVFSLYSDLSGGTDEEINFWEFVAFFIDLAGARRHHTRPQSPHAYTLPRTHAQPGQKHDYLHVTK